jgi:hypothetical protein
MSYDGLTVAISSPGEGFASRGVVRVFKYINGDWVQYGNNILGDPSNKGFGVDISLSDDGSTIAISDFSHDQLIGSSVNVHVFKYNNGLWLPLGFPIGFINSNIGGYRVSLSSDGLTVAIGVRDQRTNSSAGFVYIGNVAVYNYENNQWSQVGLNIKGKNNQDYFGHSIALSSDAKTILIGAPNIMNDQGIGYVQVFKNKEGEWVQEGEDILGVAEGGNDNFGYSVDISNDGSTIVVGAPRNLALKNTGLPEPIIRKGRVRVFQNLNNKWIQKGVDIDGDFLTHMSGQSVSISSDGNKIAIKSDAIIRVYEYKIDNWVKVGDDIANEKNNEWYSWRSLISLSGDGSSLSVGSPETGSYGSGIVRVYKCVDNTNVNQIESQKISFHPNPFNDYLFFDLKNNELIEFLIRDLSGKVLCHEIIKNKNQFDLKHLETGVYILSIKITNSIYNYKLIKE